MSLSTIEILEAVKAVLAAIPLNAESDPEGEKLFERVELYPNRNLGEAMQSLINVKKRACLVVPMGIRRNITSNSGWISVTGTKVAEVAIIYSDQAYFKFQQVVTFGGDKNLGLFAFDEKVEAALTGVEISPYGAIVLGDSDPLTLSDSAQKDAPGRQAWLVEALVPVGLICTEVI